MFPTSRAERERSATYFFYVFLKSGKRIALLSPLREVAVRESVPIIVVFVCLEDGYHGVVLEAAYVDVFLLLLLLLEHDLVLDVGYAQVLEGLDSLRQ